jgi:hypothetical protein
MMGLKDFSEIDCSITFDVFAVIYMRIPRDLVREVSVCADIGGKASHRIRLIYDKCIKDKNRAKILNAIG